MIEVKKMKDLITILLMLASMLIWGIRLEGRVDRAQSREEALEDKLNILTAIQSELAPIASDLAEVKEDVAFLRGQHSEPVQ